MLPVDGRHWMGWNFPYVLLAAEVVQQPVKSVSAVWTMWPENVLVGSPLASFGQDQRDRSLQISEVRTSTHWTRRSSTPGPVGSNVSSNTIDGANADTFRYHQS